MDNLTKSANNMVCYIYKDYLSRIKDGSSLMQAKEFDEDYFSTSDKFSNWKTEDISSTFSELKRNNLVKDDICGNFILTDECIANMQNRFKNGLSDVVDFISKFIP